MLLVDTGPLVAAADTDDADHQPCKTLLEAPGGVDVNAVLGLDPPFPSEQEIAYPGGIDSCFIVGCALPSGDFVPNPGYGSP